MAFLWRENEGFTSAELPGVGEWPPAAGALAVVPMDQGRERGRLREGHDRLERQRGAVGVVPVGDAPDRVAQDFHRRLVGCPEEASEWSRFHPAPAPDQEIPRGVTSLSQG